MALEGLRGVKKINPRLMLDLFMDHVYKDCSTAIYQKDVNGFMSVAQVKIKSQFYCDFLLVQKKGFQIPLL